MAAVLFLTFPCYFDTITASLSAILSYADRTILIRLFIKPAIHLFWIFAIGHVLAGMSVTAAGPVAGVHYDKQADMLTVHVIDIPLNEILRTVSAASGFKLSMQTDLNRSVSMNFTSVPLDKAIHRLVQPNSSAMIYTKKEDGAVVLTSVRVFDKEETLSSSSKNLPASGVTGGRNRPSDSSHKGSNDSFNNSNDQTVGRFARGNREGGVDRGNGRSLAGAYSSGDERIVR
jgi:hypothetical protein